jgi:hypothetical protein
MSNRVSLISLVTVAVLAAWLTVFLQAQQTSSVATKDKQATSTGTFVFQLRDEQTGYGVAGTVAFAPAGAAQVRLSQPITETAPPKLPSYRDDEITVESRKGNDDHIVLSITSDHGQKDVPLPPGISQIHEIRRHEDHLVVVDADIGASTSQVVIIDLNKGAVSDAVEARCDDHQIVLSITTEHGRQDMKLPSWIMRIEDIRRSADYLIVIGEIAHGASQVTIFKVNDGTVRDNFIAFDPVVSPDGRFIAFIEWFLSDSASFPDDSVPDLHAMLYDVTKSALQNRPAGATPSANDFDAGFNVYPAGNKASGYSAPARLAHGFPGFAFWSPDSTKLVFDDQAQSSLKLVLVKVPGPNTGAAPSVSTLSLDKTGLCPAAPWPNYYCDAYMAQVKFLENGLDTFFGKRRYNESVQRELRVKYADFVDFVAPR